MTHEKSEFFVLFGNQAILPATHVSNIKHVGFLFKTRAIIPQKYNPDDKINSSGLVDNKGVFLM